jgi:regulatory protein
MKPQDIEAARAVAFRFLGLAARSRGEVEKRLERDAFGPEIIAAVLAELEARGYLDDTRFARDWVADRADRKRYGRARLAAELHRKGVDRETIQETLESVDDASELARALQAARSKWQPRLLEEADSETILAEKRRLVNFLQRRGFSWPIIEQVLTEIVQN